MFDRQPSAVHHDHHNHDDDHHAAKHCTGVPD
jgi:hypothetical protein